MIKRIVKMTFRPENTGAFKAIYQANWELIRSFPGCAHVELLQGRKDPLVFFTYSVWESEERLNAYRESELFGRVWSATKALFSDKPQAWTVDEVNFEK
jgi:heme oxygenase (mycobilin-producing)